MGLSLAAPFVGESSAADLFEQLVVDLLLVATAPQAP